MIKPDEINILGKIYKIIYVDKPSDVDIYKRTSLWGQIDYWTRTIRVYDDRSDNDILDTLLHESLHGIVTELGIKLEDEECVVGLLAMGLSDMLTRNNWIK